MSYSGNITLQGWIIYHQHLRYENFRKSFLSERTKTCFLFFPVALIWEYLPLPCHHKYNQISFSWTDSDLICITLYKSYYINYIQQEQWWHSRKILLYSSWFLSLLHAWEHKWGGDVILSVCISVFISIRGEHMRGGLLSLILNFIMFASS